MPTSLAEIIKDPNYINANSDTQRAIFDKYAPLDPNYSNANSATQEAIRVKFGITQPKREVTPSDIPGAIPQPMEQEPSFGARVSALPETMARTIYGGLTGLIGAPIALGKEILTGTPKEQTLGNIMALGGRVPVSPGAQANLETIGNALSIFPAFTPAVGQAGQISQGANALAARTAPAMRNTVNALVRGPEPQMAGGGAALTQEALLRAERAQRQGIPLTKGEQLQTLAQQQLEQDLLKSNKPELVRPLTNLKQQQQEAIGKQFQKLTEETGATVADVDPIYLRDIGKIVDKPLMAEYQKSFNKYKAKYAEADNSGETLALVEYKPIVDFIESKSPTERATLDPVLNAVYENLKRNDPEGTGNINIRTMEDIYQLTGKYKNSANARQLKNLIDQTTEGAGGNLYQEARAARRQFAKEFEDVSSVAKLVGSQGEDRLVRLSDVFDNVILGSAKEDVQHITGLLKRAGPDGQQAINELKGQTIQWLKKQATGVDGITKFDNFRKAVDKLEREDKLTELFGKTGREKILDLRDTVKDALVKKPGAVNYSNTASALMRNLENMAFRIPGAKTVAELRQDYITKKQAKEAVNFNALSQGNQNQLSP